MPFICCNSQASKICIFSFIRLNSLMEYVWAMGTRVWMVKCLFEVDFNDITSSRVVKDPQLHTHTSNTLTCSVYSHIVRSYCNWRFLKALLSLKSAFSPPEPSVSLYHSRSAPPNANIYIYFNFIAILSTSFLFSLANRLAHATTIQCPFVRMSWIAGALKSANFVV